MINDDASWRTLPIMRAIVAEFSEDLDLNTCHRFLIDNTSYVIFHQTIAPWLELTRRQKFRMLILPSVGLKMSGEPPSYIGIMSEEESLLCFTA